VSRYADSDFITFNPFEGERDVRIRARTVKIVTTRKPQKCYRPEGTLHDIPAGTRARHERAIVDGEWGSYYTCCDCMTRWMRECGIPASAATDDGAAGK
jgi:hypothetical protein